MIEALSFVGPALAMCLVIASIHVYLGMHVLARDIIFVDLSLAQLAALGATVAMVIGHDEDGIWIQLVSIAFTILGAALFAAARKARAHVSQEAIVGIVYAVASAVMLLLLSHSPHGGEHIKSVLEGTLLVTTWTQVLWALGAYAVLGSIHVIFAKRFIAISWTPDTADLVTKHAGWWDFGFYIVFGIVITISVQFAGVLLVFAYLVVPALITGLFTSNLRSRLIAGWGVSLLVSLSGIWTSWTADLPTGATIVVVFGAILVGALVLRALQRSRTSMAT